MKPRKFGKSISLKKCLKVRQKLGTRENLKKIENLKFLLDNDIPESRLREISRGADAGRAGADVTSGTGQPEACDRREKKLPRVRDVLLGLRKTCQENGLNEACTAFLVGRLALDLCDVDPPI